MSEPIETRDDGIVLKFADNSDKEAIYAFALEAIKGASLPAFAEDAGENLQERIETSDAHNVLLAIDTKEANKIIGFIELDPTRSEEKVTYIRGIYVLREYRRRGIGQHMLRIIRSNTKERRVQLRVHAFTKEGLRFWEDYGFKIHHYSLYHDA